MLLRIVDDMIKKYLSVHTTHSQILLIITQPQARNYLGHFGKHLILQRKRWQTRQLQHRLPVIRFFDCDQKKRLTANIDQSHGYNLIKIAVGLYRLHRYLSVAILINTDILLLLLEKVLNVILRQLVENLALFIHTNQLMLLRQKNYMIPRFRTCLNNWHRLFAENFIH